jgi:hypothetical protein
VLKPGFRFIHNFLSLSCGPQQHGTGKNCHVL